MIRKRSGSPGSPEPSEAPHKLMTTLVIEWRRWWRKRRRWWRRNRRKRRRRWWRRQRWRRKRRRWLSKGAVKRERVSEEKF